MAKAANVFPISPLFVSVRIQRKFEPFGTRLSGLRTESFANGYPEPKNSSKAGCQFRWTIAPSDRYKN